MGDRMKRVVVLLLVASLLSGCAEAIPDAPGTETDNVLVTPVGWNNLNGTYTVMVGDNNSTEPTIVVGNHSTWLEVHSVVLNATHLSFEVVNNTIVFSNYSFELDGYLIQNGNMFVGYAPDLGNATLHTPVFPYDITVEYTIIYREWVG